MNKDIGKYMAPSEGSPALAKSSNTINHIFRSDKTISSPNTELKTQQCFKKCISDVAQQLHRNNEPQYRGWQS